MSNVTSVILTTSVAETKIADLNARGLVGCTPRFEDASHHSAGSKCMQCRVYLGGFNYLDIAEFTAALESIAWDYPDRVQLFVLGEHDERFREIPLGLAGSTGKHAR